MAGNAGWHVDDPVKVGERLKAAREEKGLSQKQLSFAGCTAVYICRIERGDRAPSLQVLHELACRLDVTAEYLARGSEEERFEFTADELAGLLGDVVSLAGGSTANLSREQLVAMSRNWLASRQPKDADEIEEAA